MQKQFSFGVIILVAIFTVGAVLFGMAESAHATVIDFQTAGLINNTSSNGEITGSEFNSSGLDLSTPDLALNVGCSSLPEGSQCVGADFVSINDFDGTIVGNFVLPDTSIDAFVDTLSIELCCVGPPDAQQTTPGFTTVTELFDFNDFLITSFFGSFTYEGDTPVSYFKTHLDFNAIDTVSFTNLGAAIPEPSTFGLFAIGLAGLGVMTRRRRKSAVT